MLNRYTTDNINVVFYKIVHQMTTTPVMPILFALEILLNIGFFLGKVFYTEVETPCLFFFGIFSYIAVAQVLYFVFKECSEYRKDGLDPSLGTHLSPWNIILGQYMALALLVGMILLLVLPVWLFVFAQQVFEMSPMVLFWGCAILFSLGVFALGLSSQAYSYGFKNTTSISGIWIFVAILGLPILGNILNLASLAGNGSLAVHIQILLVLVPILVLVTAYRYGALLPMSLECQGVFHKMMLGFVAYAFPCTIISCFLWNEEPEWKDIFDIYRIELIVFFVMYALSAGFERMQPTYRRRIYARQNGRVEYLTFPWQTGAVPGFLTGLLLSFVLICITPPSTARSAYGAVFAWLVFPLMGLVLCARQYIKNKLPTWAIIVCVLAVLVTVGVFPLVQIFSVLGEVAEKHVYAFAMACYIGGIALAFPAIKNYFSLLIPRQSASVG